MELDTLHVCIFICLCRGERGYARCSLEICFLSLSHLLFLALQVFVCSEETGREDDSSVPDSALPSVLACSFCVIRSTAEGGKTMLPFSHYLYFFYFLLCIYAAPKMTVNVSFHPLMLICSATQSSPQGDLKNFVRVLDVFYLLPKACRIQ